MTQPSTASASSSLFPVTGKDELAGKNIIVLEICSVVRQRRALALTSVAPTWGTSFVRALQEAGDEIYLWSRPVSLPRAEAHTAVITHRDQRVCPSLCSYAKLWFTGSRVL